MHYYIQTRSMEESGNKTTTLPRTAATAKSTGKCSTMQLYNTVNSVQSDADI